MKYLKRFESISGGDYLDGLKEFCNTYLSYLVDNGFSLKFTHSNDDETAINIVIYKHSTPERSLDAIFKWVDIKDDLIPFIEVLSKNYDIYQIMVEGRFGHAKECRLDEILNDKIDGILSTLPKYTEYGRSDDEILNNFIIRVLL